MPSPIKPNQLLESVASIDGDFCEKFIGSLNSPALFRDWYKSVFKDDGSLTDEFKAMVCLATEGTAGDPTTPSTVPPPVTPPPVTPPPPEIERPPPPVVSASRGTFLGMIRVTFSVSAIANRYFILRDGHGVGQVTALTGATQATFDNQVPPGRSYIYTVIAINTQSGASSFPSNGALGYSAGTNPGQPPIP